VPELDVCPVEELPPGEMKIVTSGLDAIGVYNIGGAYYALEDRCSTRRRVSSSALATEPTSTSVRATP
jgi:nitrite reductase/ring-hydroxylating ferredoxin subunit